MIHVKPPWALNRPFRHPKRPSRGGGCIRPTCETQTTTIRSTRGNHRAMIPPASPNQKQYSATIELKIEWSAPSTFGRYAPSSAPIEGAPAQGPGDWPRLCRRRRRQSKGGLGATLGSGWRTRTSAPSMRRSQGSLGSATPRTLAGEAPSKTATSAALRAALHPNSLTPPLHFQFLFQYHFFHVQPARSRPLVTYGPVSASVPPPRASAFPPVASASVPRHGVGSQGSPLLYINDGTETPESGNTPLREEYG